MQFVKWSAKVLLGLSMILALFLITANWRDRTYALRLLAWGESDIGDMERFHARIIEPSANPFHLQVEEHSEWFQQIRYTSGGSSQVGTLDHLAKLTQTQAWLVIKDDRIVYEYYSEGSGRDTPMTSFSVAKSFNSALIGAAIRDGSIDSVDDPVIEYIPELAGSGLDTLTIRHLLEMSSGIAYSEDENLFPLLGAPFSDDAKTYYYPDLRSLALRVRAGKEPVGEFFHYNNYHPLLEGIIIERVTGMGVSEYLEKTLWKPLGANYPASWSLDRENGFEKMESGINAAAVDFARLGLLYLHNGRWNGQEILSREWVQQSTAPDPDDQRPWAIWQEYPQQGMYYRFHWWGQRLPEGRYCYSAAGNFGQYIYVCPNKNLVIARFGKDTCPVDDFWAVMQSIQESIPEETP